MKISRRVGLILGAVVIVAALIGAYVVYSGQAAQRNGLNDRLTRAQSVLPLLTNQKQNLQEQLASAQSSLDTSQAKFPQSVESIEYGEYLYEIAHDCNVELTSLSFPQPASVTVGDVTYSVVSLTLPVSGALDNIFNFIATLRTDDRFASTEVNRISITISGGSASATISVNIYAHEG
jgi:hypothetical protein